MYEFPAIGMFVKMGLSEYEVYNHPSYNALVEYHSRACGNDGLDPKESKLCLYLTSKLSSANWMIVEQENGGLIIQFVEESLRFEGEPELRKEAEKQAPFGCGCPNGCERCEDE